MDPELIASMRQQMEPSHQAQAALRDRLGRLPGRRRFSPRVLAAGAACAALLALCVPLAHHFLTPQVPLHSYVVADAGSYQTEDALAELDPLPEDGASPASGGDAPVQETANRLYDALMAHFRVQYGQNAYPDWYAGAFLGREQDRLTVLLVEEHDTSELRLQIQGWVGGDEIDFVPARYSLFHLTVLMEETVEAMRELGLFSACGLNVKENRVDLWITDVTDEALALLARLDPGDDAIYVQVADPDGISVEDGVVSHAVDPSGASGADQPVSHSAEEPVAFEPTVDADEGTEDAQTAHYDILPEPIRPVDDAQGDSPAYDPAF